MDNNRQTALGVLLAGLAVLLLVSCGDDGGTGPKCTNCDFWERAFSGVGRFPAASPVDPQLIAFCSTMEPRDTSEARTGLYYHIWVARLDVVSDTVWYYQITFDDKHDFNPAWSPDGQTIAFERDVGKGDERQIFVADVSDLTNPGIPDTVTQRSSVPYSNSNPSWVTLGGSTWISFCNTPVGRADSDIGIKRYPDLDTLVWISIDPSDFAEDENGVMSYVFEDQHPTANGGNLIAFSSPNRERVGDIRVIARSEEQPDSSMVAQILINGRDSGKFTPYTFRYRPAGITVEIGGVDTLYCSIPSDTLIPRPDTVNTFLIDFVHTHGTLGVATSPAGRYVYLDGERLAGITPAPPDYVFFKCITVGTHTVYAEDVYGTVCGDTTTVEISAGDTTLVLFDCLSGQVSRGGPEPKAGGMPTVREGGWSRALSLGEMRRVWLVDLGDKIDIEDDRFYIVAETDQSVAYPALSPDGRYVAYLEGEGTSWRIVVSEVTALLAGEGEPVTTVIGLPGSWEDVEFECWRIPEKISWFPLSAGRKIVASLAVCGGGRLPDEYEIWVADLSGFLE